MHQIHFNLHLPVKVLFGSGTITKLGEEAGRWGGKAMLVTFPWEGEQTANFRKAKGSLEAAGIEVIVFDEVSPNPTAGCVNKGAALAKKLGVDVMVPVGGGSSIDCAKAIAVGATHPGAAWDYVYTQEKRPEPTRTLPIVAVTTTSGTGSHVTPYAVFTNSATRVKSTIVHPAVFPKVSIVDPELMQSMPGPVTASTGFDVFAHAFESYTNINSNPLIDALALEAISVVIQDLPHAVRSPRDSDVRARMAYADTLAGISIANVGTTLPHSMGQPISGKYPGVAHGMSLALVYPEFFKLTQAACVGKFARVARLLDAELLEASDSEAATASTEALIHFQKAIGVYTSLEALGVKKEDLSGITDDTMACPDTYVTPAVPTRAEVEQMFDRMWRQ